jgi:hypothetical protein
MNRIAFILPILFILFGFIPSPQGHNPEIEI